MSSKSRQLNDVREIPLIHGGGVFAFTLDRVTTADQSRFCTTTRFRCSSLTLNSTAAAASADFNIGCLNITKISTSPS
jgi:hypothetical protein